MASDPALPSVGDERHGLRIDAAFGEGAHSRLWQVSPESGRLDLPLLLKMPQTHALERFDNEQMVLGGLHGAPAPMLVAALDWAGTPALVIERIVGTPLTEVLARAPLPEDEVTAIGIALARAVHALHRQGVVHGELTPGHVLLRDDGSVALVDFGRATHDTLPDLFEPGAADARCPHAPPERWRGDLRSDVYSVCAVLYHLATGRPPAAPPLPPRALLPHCPPWLQELLLRGLEHSPARRWPSAAQLGLALLAPHQVHLTPRAGRLRAPGPWARLRLRLPLRRGAHTGMAEQLRRAQVIAAAIDVDRTDDRQLDAIRHTVGALMGTRPAAHLACLCVVPDAPADDEATGPHFRATVRLLHVLRPIATAIGLADGRVSLHVVESVDAAAAILAFAEQAAADHLVIGAGRAGGTIAERVSALAPCTLTLVRP
jgi:protein-serine/threonine kinase